MLEKLWDYCRHVLFFPESPANWGEGFLAFITVLILGIFITWLVAWMIVAPILRRTHREEITALLRSRFAWGWAFAVCAVLQFLDVVFLWYRDALGSLAATIPLLLNIAGLSLVGLLFCFQVRSELRRLQQVVKRANEGR